MTLSSVISLKNVVTMYKSCRQNGLNEYLKKQTNPNSTEEVGFKQACNPPASFPWCSPLPCPLVTCYHSTFVFFMSLLSPLACTTSSLLSILPSLLLSFPRHVSPLSFLFYALSDMSQGSSDEDSEEEEEDFARVQFGSRYTAARCWCVCLCVLAQ